MPWHWFYKSQGVYRSNECNLSRICDDSSWKLWSLFMSHYKLNLYLTPPEPFYTKDCKCNKVKLVPDSQIWPKQQSIKSTINRIYKTGFFFLVLFFCHLILVLYFALSDQMLIYTQISVELLKILNTIDLSRNELPFSSVSSMLLLSPPRSSDRFLVRSESHKVALATLHWIWI